MSESAALVIRPNMPYAINRIPNNSYRLTRRNKRRNQILPEPVPPIAFLMMGHGSQRVEYKTVPKGCILVVATKSGEMSRAIDLYPKQLNFLDSANRTAILDPVNHKAELYKLFGPVSIFTEGETYPEFHYTLFTYFSENSGKDPNTGMMVKIKPVLKLSGIVKLEGEIPADPLLIESIGRGSARRDLYKNKPTPGVIRPLVLFPEELEIPFFLVDDEEPDIMAIENMSNDEFNNRFENSVITLNPDAYDLFMTEHLLNLISGMFKFSNAFNNNYLNPIWIKEIIEKDLKKFSEKNPKPELVTMTVGDYIEDLLTEPLEFTQEELFMKCGPGVYYNFICRTTRSDTNRNPFHLTKGALQAISEAETVRKNVVRKGYNGKGGKRNQRKQRNRRTIRKGITLL